MLYKPTYEANGEIVWINEGGEKCKVENSEDGSIKLVKEEQRLDPTIMEDGQIVFATSSDLYAFETSAFNGVVDIRWRKEVPGTIVDIAIDNTNIEKGIFVLSTEGLGRVTPDGTMTWYCALPAYIQPLALASSAGYLCINYIDKVRTKNKTEWIDYGGHLNYKTTTVFWQGIIIYQVGVGWTILRGTTYTVIYEDHFGSTDTFGTIIDLDDSDSGGLYSIRGFKVDISNDKNREHKSIDFCIYKLGRDLLQRSVALWNPLKHPPIDPEWLDGNEDTGEGIYNQCWTIDLDMCPVDGIGRALYMRGQGDFYRPITLIAGQGVCCWDPNKYGYTEEGHNCWPVIMPGAYEIGIGGIWPITRMDVIAIGDEDNPIYTQIPEHYKIPACLKGLITKYRYDYDGTIIYGAV